MADQPALTSDKGVVLTVGINVIDDRCALVLPIATDSTGIAALAFCQTAVESFEQGALPLLLDVLSTLAWVSFIQAQGMDAGTLYPYRKDFANIDNPGTVITDPLPSSVGALITFYEDTRDITPGDRMRHSRVIVPGIAEGMVDLGRINSGALANLQTFGDALVQGFKKTGGSDPKFYRVLSAPKVGDGNAVALKRLVTTSFVRGYVGAQRRRLLPRT